MYDLLGTCLALSALLTINALASLAAAALWRLVARFTKGWSAAARARLLFALRIFPPAAAAWGVLALFIPAYVFYEPRPTMETVSPKLGALALVSAVGLALALWRGLAAWRTTGSLVADWMQHAKAVQLRGINIPTYRIEHRFPIIAIIGVVRPRLFIAESVLETLSGEEIAAAITHEVGHLESRDNLKRWLMRACRDVLTIVPCGRRLDREWAAAAEAAADEHAAQEGGSSAALDLAAALIQIARMIPRGVKPTMPAGAFLLGDDQAGGIESRVRRLAEIAGADTGSISPYAKLMNVATWACFGLFLFTVTLGAASPIVLATLHSGIERIVSALS